MMMALWVAVLIGMSSNIDNVGIGLSYGVRGTRVPWLFSTMMALTSFVACFMGGFTAIHLGHVIPAVLSNWLGSGILVCLGLWTIIQTLFIASYDEVDTRQIGFSEMMFIALAQGLSDLSVGFGVGFAKLHVFYIAVSVGVFSFLFFLVPIWLGVRFTPQKLGKSATVFSGLLLIFIGLLM